MLRIIFHHLRRSYDFKDIIQGDFFLNHFLMSMLCNAHFIFLCLRAYSAKYLLIGVLILLLLIVKSQFGTGVRACDIKGGTRS
jgi:hypothetical protein